MDLSALERIGILVVRPGALLMAAPVFGAAFAPPLVRVGVLLLITFALAPVIALPADLGQVSTTLVAGRELLIGLALSLSIRVLIAGAELAGHLSGFQIGFDTKQGRKGFDAPLPLSPTHSVAEMHGAGLTTPVARRWKTQINENSKLPAFNSELPEADHNEVCGWDASEGLAPMSAVFLDDRDLNERERRRIELTADIARRGAATVERIESRGETRVERAVFLFAK